VRDLLHPCGRYPSLGYEFSTDPIVSYTEPGDIDLRVARRLGTEWRHETVDTGRVAPLTSLAIDPTGHPGIAYLHEDSHTVRLAHWNGADWSVDTIDDLTVSSSRAELAFDSVGRPGVAYVYHDVAAELRFARWSGSDWEITVADADIGPSVGGFSVAFDPQDRPWYASLASGTWSSELIARADLASVGTSNSLAFDASGFPLLAYSYDSAARSDVRLATSDGSTWSTERVGGVGGGGGVYHELAMALVHEPMPLSLGSPSAGMAGAWSMKLPTFRTVLRSRRGLRPPGPVLCGRRRSAGRRAAARSSRVVRR